MKHIVKFIVLIGMLSLFSCQDNFEGNSMSKKQIETIIIEGQDFIPSVESRTSVGDGGKFFWVRTDTLGIFPSRGGYQVAFPLTDMDGDEASTATFTGGGWGNFAVELILYQLWRRVY